MGVAAEGSAMSGAAMDGHVAEVRRFNRFYTQKIGVLEEGLAQSPFSLTESRVLYELAHRDRPTASALGRDLGLDAGYLSRILRGFLRNRLLRKLPSDADRRQSLLALTAKGRTAFAALDAQTRRDVARMLKPLANGRHAELVRAMHRIESLLGAPPEVSAPGAAVTLRPHRPGDLGWIVHRHAVLYAEEYGWDNTFEALVAEIAAKFIREFKPDRERCWMAEYDGAIVGSVLLVEKTRTVAQLRLLLVEPSARGLGIGRRLVDECIEFARRVGYGKLILWTNSILHAARHTYERAGFELVEEEKHHSFGHDLLGQFWELKLK